MINDHLFPPPILRFIFIINFCIFIVIPSSYSDDDDLHEQYVECSRPFQCGPEVREIRYPFWGGNRSHPYCGRQEFLLNCHENDQYTTIESESQKFRVLRINTDQRTVKIAREDLWDDFCFERLDDTAFDQKIFTLLWKVENRNLSVFYDCNDASSDSRPNKYNCSKDGEERIGFYKVDGEEGLFQNVTDLDCKGVIKVPILWDDALHITQTLGLQGNDWLMEALHQGFEVRYNADVQSCSACLSSRGICGSNSSDLQSFACLCLDEPHPRTCPSTPGPPVNPPKSLRTIIIAISAAVIGVTVTFIVVCVCIRQKMSAIMSISLFRKITTKNDQHIEAFIRNYGPLAPERYSFSDVKKMTGSFKDKLGQGGYGGVYKGRLPDGNLVAVKLLNKSKWNGQEFVNEVESISRTSHVNVVRLLGFCIEGSKRALIYEFMPNGSLEKFISKADNSKTGEHLGWEKLYQIAIGIAKGLEYLHRGCNTRILHFDIKPHNILLDEDFCPKISDFGLAKLCLKKESIVSMLEARGTIGYIAPEVFSRNFGGVSRKSDVYSYGMMVLEMVGGKNLAVESVNSSEIYFPNWIYRHVERGKDFTWHGASTEEENRIAQKMIIVGLWCIQTHPSNRPSMNKVIDMLQESIEALQIPPKPFSCPPRPPSDYSTISME